MENLISEIVQNPIMQNIFLFVVIGFFAQIIDGALGMAYGVSATTFMLSFGVPPQFASAAVHSAETVTTFLSGVSHWRLGNVKKDLVLRLLIPGVIGAFLGAYALSALADKWGNAIKPWISVYLLLMGIYILYKAARTVVAREVTTHLVPLGLAGGFMDAIGGGGWGPIVVTTLVARGNNPRFTIGSVNLVEFFVTLTASLTFIFTLGFLEFWKAILGLAIGGAVAAPLAAFVCRFIPTRNLMYMVGSLIVLLQARALLQLVDVEIPTPILIVSGLIFFGAIFYSVVYSMLHKKPLVKSEVNL